MEEFYGSGIVKEEQIQMEIRLLYGNEIQWAVQTAHEVYEQCVRPYTRNAAEVQQYYDYMNLPNLSQEMLAGRLFLWGAFENGQMCGVSAMQNVGHITALYVRPQYFRRRIGSNLVDRMCNFAASRLQCGRVTVQAAPSAANYFYHTGFTLIQGAPAGMYVPLERRIWSVPMTQGYMGNIGGKRQYIRAGRWCAGGAAAAHKAGDHLSEKEGKRPGGALAYCGHHRLRSGGSDGNYRISYHTGGNHGRI